MPSIFKSNKNSGAGPGSIYKSKRPSGLHSMMSPLEAAAAARGPSALRTAGALGKHIARRAFQAGATALAGPLGTVGAKVVTDKRLFLAVLLFIFAFFYIMFMSGGDDNQLTSSQYGQNPLQIMKQGPFSAKKGQMLQYTLSVTYPGTATSLVISDPLPDGTKYITSSPKATFKNNTLTWDSKDYPSFLTGSVIQVVISFTLQATKDNNYAINYATASLSGGSVGGSASAGGGCGNANFNTSDFDTLMTGQGRCTNILGNENSFVSAVLKNAGSKLALKGKDSELHAIYKAAVAKNINPLIFVAIWGVEASFQDNGTQFGCKPFGSGFTSQLDCSVNKVLGHWMTVFDQSKTKPVIIADAPGVTRVCKYSDPFLYAYEWYTPVCHASDSNDNARKNFVMYYKLLSGH